MKVQSLYTFSHQLLAIAMAHHLPFLPLTKDAIASVLGVSTRTIEKWVEQNVMPAPAEIGNRVFWHPDLFYGWLNERLLIPRKNTCELNPTMDATPRKTGATSERNQLRAQAARRLASIEADRLNWSKPL